MSECILIRAPSRIHFGLSSLGHLHDQPQFAGVGMMVDVPGVELEIAPAETFCASGPLSERAERCATRIAQRLSLPTLPQLAINILSTQREHTGMGIGTQLGLSVAAGISQALGFPWRDPLRLSMLTGRGRRSAVGTYGFLLGGLIVDAGHLPGEPLGNLALRLKIPADWRIVLLTAPNLRGQSGSDEDRALAALPPIPAEVTAELEDIGTHQIAPSAETGDFERFSQSVYRYGCLAGQCFVPAQGGVFSTQETAQLIAWLRSQGIAGVGQSSWGPTVFAMLPNEMTTEHLCKRIRQHPVYRKYQLQAGGPANAGATMETRA